MFLIIKPEPFFKVDMSLRKSQSFLLIFLVKQMRVWLTLLIRRGLLYYMLVLQNAKKLTAGERRDKSSEISRSFLFRACLDFSFERVTVEHSSVTGTRRSYECFEGA